MIPIYKTVCCALLCTTFSLSQVQAQRRVDPAPNTPPPNNERASPGELSIAKPVVPGGVQVKPVRESQIDACIAYLVKVEKDRTLADGQKIAFGDLPSRTLPTTIDKKPVSVEEYFSYSEWNREYACELAGKYKYPGPKPERKVTAKPAEPVIPANSPLAKPAIPGGVNVKPVRESQIDACIAYLVKVEKDRTLADGQKIAFGDLPSRTLPTTIDKKPVSVEEYFSYSEWNREYACELAGKYKYPGPKPERKVTAKP
jgi:nitrogen fixation protein